MQIKRGIAVSPGVAIGPAVVLGTEHFRIPHRPVSENAVAVEQERFHAALDAVCEEISVNEKLARERLNKKPCWQNVAFTLPREVSRARG